MNNRLDSMKKFLPTSNKGFTLIELMVVVTIIAFLAVIGMVSFTNVQAQARDGRRRADIDAIATALEANRDPLAGIYPAYVATIFADAKIPVDPINATYNTFSYVYTTNTNIVSSDSKTFLVCARLEKANGNFTNAGGATPASGSTATYYCRKSQQ